MCVPPLMCPTVQKLPPAERGVCQSPPYTWKVAPGPTPGRQLRWGLLLAVEVLLTTIGSFPPWFSLWRVADVDRWIAKLMCHTGRFHALFGDSNLTLEPFSFTA